MKSNQKGFTIVEILIVIVIIGLVATVSWLVYDRQKNRSISVSKVQPISSQEIKETPKQEKEKVADPYEGWKTYSDVKLGYAFKYPAEWVVTPVNYGDKLGVIYVDSPDIKLDELSIGATDIIKGSRVSLYAQNSGDYREFIGLLKQLKESGTIKPVELDLGGHKAIEYSFAYEGPENTYVRLAISSSQYIETSFISEGKESAHTNYDSYKKILASINNFEKN